MSDFGGKMDLELEIGVLGTVNKKIGGCLFLRERSHYLIITKRICSG